MSVFFLENTHNQSIQAGFVLILTDMLKYFASGECLRPIANHEESTPSDDPKTRLAVFQDDSLAKPSMTNPHTNIHHSPSYVCRQL